MKHCPSLDALKQSRFLRSHLGALCLVSLVAVLYISTVRPGHIWADDFAMYVHHAENIVEGRAYADTGYIYNPRTPAYSPGMYPPMFPLLLAPLYKFFGLSLLPMKLEQIAFFVLTLVILYSLWRRELGPSYSLALIAILGFNPAFWAAKDSVLSDLPFLLFFYLVALIVKSADRRGKRWWLWSLLLGISLYIATSTRTAGIALMAGVMFYDALRYHRITRLSGVAVALCIGSLMLQSRVIGSAPGGYVEQVHAITVHTVFFNSWEYVRTLAGFWVGSVHGAFSDLVIAVVTVLIIAGIWHELRSGRTLLEALVLPYLGILLLWPFAAGMRAVFPVIPWAVFLALRGLQTFSGKLVPRWGSAAVGGLLLVIAIPYTQAYRNMDFGPIRETEGLAEFRELCAAVRDHTTPEDVFIFFRARSLSLYTGRRASTYNYRGSETELSEYARNIHAAYLITTNAFSDDHGLLSRFVRDHSESLQLAYQNAEFAMYRIRKDEESATAR